MTPKFRKGKHVTIYESEAEQLEALKKWWQENGRSIVLGVVIGTLMIGGWTMWKNTRKAEAEQASDLYQQLLTAMQDKNTDSALKQGERLVEKYDNSAYAVFGNFFVAKVQMEKGDLSAAKSALQAILDSRVDENLKHIARLRLIRILSESGDPEAGLRLISDTPIAQSGEFEGSYEELRGDLSVLLDRNDEARAAYQRAQSLGGASPYLPLKLDDLAGAPIVEVAQ